MSPSPPTPFLAGGLWEALEYMLPSLLPNCFENAVYLLASKPLSSSLTPTVSTMCGSESTPQIFFIGKAGWLLFLRSSSLSANCLRRRKKQTEEEGWGGDDTPTYTFAHASNSLTCTEVYVVIFECLLLVEEQFMYPTPFLVLVLFPPFFNVCVFFPCCACEFLTGISPPALWINFDLVWDACATF